MDIYEHSSCTFKWEKPSDMTESQCATLPTCEIKEDSGVYHVSFWKPSEDDLECLRTGGTIALWVRLGNEKAIESHPVVAVGVAEPDTVSSAEDQNG